MLRSLLKGLSLFVLLVAGQNCSIFAQGVFEEWVARYNGTGNGLDEPAALAVDNGGNVIVAGGSQGSGTGWNYATVKYTASGTLLWARTYNGSGNGTDLAKALVIDQDGNVYVTGFSTGGNTLTDYTTIKYDPNGNQLWVRGYNGAANGDDQAVALILDSYGNLYVTGQSQGTGNGSNHVTIKYDLKGNQLWVKEYNGPRNSRDETVGIAADPGGNLYVAGRSWSGISWDCATVKYSNTGDTIWTRRYRTLVDADQITNLATDRVGNLYLAGQSWRWGAGTAYDFAVFKYDPYGNLLWSKYYDGPGHDHDLVFAAGVDGSGNLYETGPSWGQLTSYDYATVKYDPNGNLLWARRYSGTRGGGDFSTSIAIDSSGNVYVSGYEYLGYAKNICDFATIKYDPQGNQLWVKSYDGFDGIDQAKAVAVDGDGNIYVAGLSAGNGSSNDYVLIKYSPCNINSPRAGDTNADGRITLTDVISAVNYVFNRPNFPYCSLNNKLCWLSGLLCRGDTDGSRTITLVDVIRLVNYIFNKPGGPWTPVPSGACCLPVP